MKDFLSSEEALKVYSNSQELLALANIFNISINVFTYKGNSWRWTEVGPDADMVGKSEHECGNSVPDMALYHSEDTHYDLLVRDDSRLAKMGLLAGIVKKKGSRKSSGAWKTVGANQSEVKKDFQKDEKLLTEETDTTEKDKDIEEEITLLRGKKSGHKRTTPQNQAESMENSRPKFDCDQCDHKLESQGLLYAHLNDHENNKSQFTCDSCELVFTTQITLEKHNNETHISQDVLHSDEWNCNDCPFQGNNISELMNHLKLSVSGHQPSETDEVKRSIFDDYKQCYTCKLEFNGYYTIPCTFSEGKQKPLCDETLVYF